MKKLILIILFLNSIIGFSQNKKSYQVVFKGIVLSEVAVFKHRVGPYIFLFIKKNSQILLSDSSSEL